MSSEITLHFARSYATINTYQACQLLLDTFFVIFSALLSWYIFFCPFSSLNSKNVKEGFAFYQPENKLLVKCWRQHYLKLQWSHISDNWLDWSRERFGQSNVQFTLFSPCLSHCLPSSSLEPKKTRSKFCNKQTGWTAKGGQKVSLQLCQTKLTTKKIITLR